MRRDLDGDRSSTNLARPWLPAKPLDGFSLTAVSGTCAKGITLANMLHVTLKDIQVTGFTGPLLSTYNVKGKGLDGAVALEPAQMPAPVPALKKPFVLR